MKKFDNFKDFSNWIKKNIGKVRQQALPVITEQVYKDSDKYTYRDTGDMYNSATLNSDFKNGLIIERTPYVRRRYYEGGKPGKNKRAIARWFERTKFENIDKYKKQYISILNKFKGE